MSIVTSKPRTARKGVFKYERDLQLELANIPLKLNGPRNTFLRREVPLGGIIPDLVYVRFNEIPDSELWPRRWVYRHAVVIWLLRNHQALGLHTIAATCYAHPNSLKDTIADLIKSGALIESPNGEYSLSPRMRAVDAEVIAVEAKLSRWGDAIDQASNYRGFADRTFVAMDAERVPRAPQILRQFLELGVGLCAVVPEKIEWLVYPQVSTRSMGVDREYLVASAASCSRQTEWSLR